MSRISAALFNNNRKEKDSHPDFTGAATVSKENLVEIVKALQSNNEVPLKLAGWTKTSKNGNKYISLSIELDTYKLNKSSNSGSDQEVPF